MAEAYTYILQCADGTLYVGWTVDLNQRVKAHNEGIGARYTRGRRPAHLVFWEKHDSKSTARQRERAIRRMSRAQKLRLIASQQPAPSAAIASRSEVISSPETRREEMKLGNSVS